jgi:hypothetical protein
MPIITTGNAKEFEEKGHADLEFVGFKYTGDRSVTTNNDIRERAGYNGPGMFQQGQTYLAILPTNLDNDHVENSNMGVHALEARGDFEVIYDAERLAEALLSRNYLPTDVFYEGFDRWKRAKVLEKLPVDDAGRVFDQDDETPYREQLRDIAGVDVDDEVNVSKQREDEYVDRFSRSDASAVVKVLRDEIDKDLDLRTAGLTDMAHFMTHFTPESVEFVADVTLSDGDEKIDSADITQVDDSDD